MADTVPAGGVAVTKLEQFGPDPLHVAATGLVAAPATSEVVAATSEKTPAMSTAAVAQVATPRCAASPPCDFRPAGHGAAQKTTGHPSFGG